jgi:hypothetical protein
MLIGTAIVGAVFLLNPPSASLPKTDVLHMKNGDRMTCAIKSMDAGALYVDVDYVDGTITVGWSRIAALESTRLFLVQVDDGSVYTGRISINPVEGTDSVLVSIEQTNGTRVVFDKSRIAGLSGTSDKFWGRLSGNVTSGFSFTKGNSSTTYNFSSNVSYPRPRWSASIGFNSNLSSSEGSPTTTRNQLNLTVGRLMRWNNWFYTGFGGLLQSDEQQIDLQTNLGGGVGRYLKKTSNLKSTLVGGLVWQGTTYDSSLAIGPQDMIGVMLLGSLNYVRFKRTSLEVTANAIPSLNDFGRFFFNTNASYFLKLFGALNWNLSFYGNWDTQPPSGSSGSDYGFNSGISWSFGNQ